MLTLILEELTGDYDAASVGWIRVNSSLMESLEHALKIRPGKLGIVILKIFLAAIKDMQDEGIIVDFDKLFYTFLFSDETEKLQQLLKMLRKSVAVPLVDEANTPLFLKTASSAEVSHDRDGDIIRSMLTAIKREVLNGILEDLGAPTEPARMYLNGLLYENTAFSGKEVLVGSEVYVEWNTPEGTYILHCKGMKNYFDNTKDWIAYRLFTNVPKIYNRGIGAVKELIVFGEEGGGRRAERSSEFELGSYAPHKRFQALKGFLIPENLEGFYSRLVIGPSSVGKTTFLKTLAQDFAHKHGYVVVILSADQWKSFRWSMVSGVRRLIVIVTDADTLVKKPENGSDKDSEGLMKLEGPFKNGSQRADFESVLLWVDANGASEMDVPALVNSSRLSNIAVLLWPRIPCDGDLSYLDGQKVNAPSINLLKTATDRQTCMVITAGGTVCRALLDDVTAANFLSL